MELSKVVGGCDQEPFLHGRRLIRAVEWWIPRLNLVFAKTVSIMCWRRGRAPRPSGDSKQPVDALGLWSLFRGQFAGLGPDADRVGTITPSRS